MNLYYVTGIKCDQDPELKEAIVAANSTGQIWFSYEGSMLMGKADPYCAILMEDSYNIPGIMIIWANRGEMRLWSISSDGAPKAMKEVKG